MFTLEQIAGCDTVDPMEEMKTCTKCRETKSLTQFASRKPQAGYATRCRDCTREYLRAYRRRHPDKWVTYRETYKSRHGEGLAERQSAYQARYYRENRERAREAWKRRRDADPEKYRNKARESSRLARERLTQRTDAELDRDFHRLRPAGKKCRSCERHLPAEDFSVARAQADGRFARCRECDACNYAQKTRKKLGPFWISRGIDPRKCVYCGGMEPEDVDHFIPVARGGSNELSNLVPACRGCNRGVGGKFARDPWEWIREAFPEQEQRLRDLNLGGSDSGTC